jgi:hypothetical protein
MVTAAYAATGWKASGTRIPPHYTPASLGAAIPASKSGKANNVKTVTGPLASRVGNLALRAALLNYQAAVTNVLDSYGYALDHKQWDQAADLFADNGTLELGQQGVYVGKARVRKALDQFARKGLNDHVYLQTVVTVAQDRLTAYARGVELIFSGDELSEGVFENSFVNQAGTWKIRSVHFYPRMIVDAAAGWAKSAKPAPGPSKELPPDRPPTSVYEIYPKFSVAPFHFTNPVTGKPPQYPEGFQGAARVDPVMIDGRLVTDLEARLEQAERNVAEAELYDVAENLIDAHGYALDGGSVFVSQILQPVIDVAKDGKSANVRARRLDLGGTSGAAGYWSAGPLEGKIVSEQAAWKFLPSPSPNTWTAPFPGGWAQIP